MPFDFDTLTKFINSPPGQVAAGSVLAGIVWKLFEKVESILTDDTKHRIARWFRVKSFESGVVADETANWSYTFAKVFDGVFGDEKWSWLAFRRSCAATYLTFALMSVITALLSSE